MAHHLSPVPLSATHKGIRSLIVGGFICVVLATIYLLYTGLKPEARAQTRPSQLAASSPSTAPFPPDPMPLSSPAPMQSPLQVTPPRPPYPPVRFRTGLEELPTSLQGTHVDGAITIDQAGNLVPSARVRALFEYFLSLEGIEPMDTVRERLSAYIRAVSPEPAASQTLALLDRYLRLRQASQGLTFGITSDSSAESLEQAKRKVLDLRARYLTPDQHAGLFGREEAYDSYQLTRLKILNNTGLGEMQKATLLQREFQNLPADMKANMGPMIQYESLQRITEALQNGGATAAAVRQAREQLVGEAVTQRLDALEQTDQQWHQRIDRYLSDKQIILTKPNQSQAQEDAQVTALRAQMFTAREQVRLPAYEQLAAQGMTLDAVGNLVKRR